MYDPILFVKDKESKKIICCLCEIEVGMLYCLSQGLVQKDMEDILCKSHGDIKKWMAILYDKVNTKFRRVGILVAWTIENEIFFEIKELAEKNGVAKKVVALKQTIAQLKKTTA